MTKRFYRNIVFSKTPLTTHFRYEDEFQVYPCDFANAPKSDYCHDFPLVIEYWIDEDEIIEVDDIWEDLKDHVAENARQNKKLNQLTRLLTAITNHRIYSYGETEFKWGYPLPAKELNEEEKLAFDNQSSQAFLAFYTYPNLRLDLQIKDFVVKNHPTTKGINQALYFYHDPFDDRTKEVTFPNTIVLVLKKYFELDKESRKIVSAVIHLICNGLEIQNKMKSLSFLSFVSAIETLANYEYRKMNNEIKYECPNCQALKASPLLCEKCNRPIWGVKAKFKTFLKTYVSPSAGSVTKYNRIYNLRSNIVHNGMLLLGDEQLNWAKSEKADSQYMTHLEVIQAAKVSLVNWLIFGPDKEPVN